MQNITAAESAELIASGSTIVSSPVLTGMLRMLTVGLCSLLRNLCASGIGIGRAVVTAALRRCGCRSRSGCLIRSVVVRSYKDRSCGTQRTYVIGCTCCHFTCTQVGFCPAAASSSCSPSSAVSASAVSVCSSDTRLRTDLLPPAGSKERH